ncbi:Bax inhibitor-1/YccA family protein [Fusobacterium perfoetens]|uniref:Bax inhibitor-1/YccA family protein n=1 Tax=Fusobacterium perfoetens TaxID=852 RepID=UPI000485740A|nr:Bax inhibitor-1/YccA family protein [Fusobacterium perfoetens]MCI6151866.1 Bax inhibitor-1/YccA family protein [Fusobacterium perfoetens]MDY3236773.1 Bax inhibitor-1/YccA family protein [Fusobacterium perfoetens]
MYYNDEKEYMSFDVNNKLLRSSFAYMIIGLFITFLVPAYIIFYNQNLIYTIMNLYLPIVILEFVVVIGLSGMLHKISTMTARLLFFFYSFLNGLVFSLIGVMVGDIYIIGYTLFTTIIMFGVTAAYGYFTSEDLSNYGGYLRTGLISIIIISIINIFLKAPSLYWMVTIMGVVIFSALTAYDVNKIKNMAYEISYGDESTIEKLGVIGALTLYLDFINLFLYLLRIFSRKGRD